MVFPQKDMVIVTTAEEIDGTRVFPLVEQYLLANLTDPQKGRDAWAYEHLQKVLCQWEAPAVYEPSSSYLQALLQDKTYLLKSVDSQEQHQLRLQLANSRLAIAVDGIQSLESSCVTDRHGETTFAIEIPSNSPCGGRNSALGPGPTLPTTPGWTRIPCYSQSAGGNRAITRPGNSNSMGRSSSCGSPTG